MKKSRKNLIGFAATLVIGTTLLGVPTAAMAQLTENLRLTGSDTAAFDQFGFSAALSGTTAVVGAKLNDNPGTNSGSAYVFNNTVPEPATLSLLALGSVTLLRRRRSV